MKRKGRILIIDDNQELLLAVKLLLRDEFEYVLGIKNPNMLPSKIQEHLWDVYILDMNFSAGQASGNEGLYWMRRILKHDANAVIVLVTAYAEVKLAVQAMKEGAYDFIPKPWDDDKFKITIINAWKYRKSSLQISDLQSRQELFARECHKSGMFIPGRSKGMKKILSIISKAAKTDANILITGENGTGKEVLAREIHRLSERPANLFIPLDLGSINSNLFESELFGYKKGAFTDAREDKKGRLLLADGGTLFLDEIGNLEYRLQSKLLSVLQTKLLTPLGDNNSIPINTRFISATNESPETMINESRFREDLLYRLNTIRIEIPPLRKRKEDIPELITHFITVYGNKYKKKILSPDKNVISLLQEYSWPGNIRELEHSIEKAIILCENNTITTNDFSLEEKIHFSPPDELNLELNEISLIRQALEKHNGNISESAKELGISRKTMYNKLNKYGL